MRMRTGVKDISQQIRSPPDQQIPLGRELQHNRGVDSRGPAFVDQALTAVQDFDAFAPDWSTTRAASTISGPSVIEDETVFWKIDLYERAIV